jgi:hypothetical protein
LTTLASSRYLHDDVSRTDQFCAGKSGSPSAKRATDDLLSLLNDGGEMLGAFQALGVEFVDVSPSGWFAARPSGAENNLHGVSATGGH